ncbi:M48 family metallopeptidase [Bacillus sp. 31A1R]|uniref:M48 family metallopeptidase n=1 Tax=Robertmurraya mangrovi TaxID=3098077 RepID=A0ABU5IZI7_9BACI|nr:M48 family metallopeptidase [Bacillus sp. 31A1R]MDZ5472580.1 M48 family metallopeptidase [Bacillus sp. 31A1R]
MYSEVKDHLVHRKESIYFALVVLFSILSYIFLAISVIGIAIVLLMIFVSVILHGLMMGGIRRNGVKLSLEQFPELYEKATMVAKDMGISKMPDIYVVESEGVLNAFATRFFGRNMVVLYSGIFELVERGADQEVLFVLSHEFAHLKRKHVTIGILLLPAMWIPFVGNAYLRACEYTCDRYATYYIQDLNAAKNALLMLAIGKELYGKVNQEAYMKQIETEEGIFVWLSEKLSTHPHLPKRVYEISKLFDADCTIELKEPKKKVWIGLTVLMAATIGMGVISFVGLKALEKLDLFSEAMMGLESASPLMDAASTNDVDEIARLISEGEDVNQADDEGSTPLHWAIQDYSYEAVELLLQEGANPNTANIYDTTPLISAVFMGDAEMVSLLLEYGVDTNYVDSEGYTAYDYAVEYEYNDIIELLENR